MLFRTLSLRVLCYFVVCAINALYSLSEGVCYLSKIADRINRTNPYLNHITFHLNNMLSNYLYGRISRVVKGQ